VNIEYAVSREDVEAMYSYVWRHSWFFKRKVFLFPLCVSGTLLLIDFLVPWKVDATEVLIAVGPSLCLIFYLPFCAKFRAKPGSRTLSIDRLGIHTQIGQIKGDISWSKMAELFATEEHVFLLRRNLNGFAIPRRAFLDGLQRNEFVSLCQDCLKGGSSEAAAQRRARFVFGSGLAFLIIFSPWLYSFGWHLRHGELLEYRGQNFVVPNRWIADPKPQGRQGLTLRKWPVTVFDFLRFRWLTGSVSITPGLPLKNRTASEVEESFEKGFWTYPPGPPDGAVSGPVRRGAPPNDLFCMRYTPSGGAYPIVVECLWKQGSWNINVIADDSDVDTISTILGVTQ
jgi:hypothetical protein